MKNLFPVGASFLMIFYIGLSCKKPLFNDLGGTSILSGVIMLHDTLWGNYGYTPEKNLTLYLRNPTDSVAYLYSVQSDNLGQFSFSGIDTTKEYQITASFDTAQIHYSARAMFTPSGKNFLHIRDTLLLTPDTNSQNGIHLIVEDTTFSPLSYVTVHVFNSSVLFHADSVAGKVFDMISNGAGFDNKFNVSPATYYFRAKVSFGNANLTREDSMTVGEKGIKTMRLVLRSTALDSNGIELHITDTFATPVANANIYFYRSLAVFQNDLPPYSNSLFAGNSNAGGYAAIYNIEPATYYIRAIKVVNSTLTLSGTGNTTIVSNSVNQVNIILQ